jgi:hypothetical protein
MTKVFGIVFYVIAGFFIYMASLLAFISSLTLQMKIFVMAVFLVPAFMVMYIGLRLNKSSVWRLDLGIVLLSVAGFMALLVLTMVCLWMTPELQSMVGADAFAIFEDYETGMAFIAIQIAVGLLLIKEERKST